MYITVSLMSSHLSLSRAR